MCDNAVLHPFPRIWPKQPFHALYKKKSPELTSLKDDNSKFPSVVSSNAVTYLHTRFLNSFATICISRASSQPLGSAEFTAR